MKHCIICKFKAEYSKEAIDAYVPRIREIFDGARNIKGIHDIKVLTNCIDRENRYNLMIMLDMDREALEEYDACEAHKLWKAEFGVRLEKKAIFDTEEL